MYVADHFTAMPHHLSTCAMYRVQLRGAGILQGAACRPVVALLPMQLLEPASPPWRFVLTDPGCWPVEHPSGRPIHS